MRALVHADAGRAAGLGHLQRSVALACALRDHGADAVFVLPPGSGATSVATRRGFAVVEHELGADGGATAALARRLGCDAAIVDSYGAGAAFFERLREAGLPAAAIDDMARFAFACEAVVNGGAAAEQLPYRSSTGTTRFLLGPAYALLRPEFREPPASAPRRGLLLLAGGSDPFGLLPSLVESIAEAGVDEPVTAVVGPLADATGIERSASRSRLDVEIRRDPPDLRALMLRARVAVSAAGQTLYELAACATPTVAVQVVDNQNGNLRALAAAGAVAAATRADAAGSARELLRDETAARRLAAAARGLVDGHGAARAARSLLAALAPERPEPRRSAAL